MLNTNEMYISEPYFMDSEAVRIRTAIVDCILSNADEAIRAGPNVTIEAEKEDTVL